MPNDIRLSQFLPFDSLKGFKEEIAKKEIIEVEKPELSEDIIEEINNILQQITKFDDVSLVYFKNGKYIQMQGIVTKIDSTNKYLQVVKEKILFENIYKIEIIQSNEQF